MALNLLEFRCTTIGCGKLLAKCDKCSFLEIKCKRCGNYSYFTGGKAITFDEKRKMDYEFLENTFFGK